MNTTTASIDQMIHKFATETVAGRGWADSLETHQLFDRVWLALIADAESLLRLRRGTTIDKDEDAAMQAFRGKLMNLLLNQPERLATMDRPTAYVRTMLRNAVKDAFAASRREESFEEMLEGGKGADIEGRMAVGPGRTRIEYNEARIDSLMREERIKALNEEVLQYVRSLGTKNARAFIMRFFNKDESVKIAEEIWDAKGLSVKAKQDKVALAVNRIRKEIIQYRARAVAILRSR